MTALAIVLLAGCATTTPAQRPAPAPPQASDATFQTAAQRIAAIPSSPRARNVIIFIGDGMGVATVTAARIYAGQRQGRDGESYNLTLDTFPHTALSRTYGADAQISDSAPTATALVSGVKTDAGVIGVTAGATPGDCASAAGHISRSLFEIAEAQGMGTGIVSTARLTHATPAAAYAHVAYRDWESDVAAARSGGAQCIDIARQLIEWPEGDGFEIALGGGRANFLPNTAPDPETPTTRGARGDGRDLTGEWTARPGHVFVWNAAQLAAAPADARVLGLFSPSHMAYESARATDAGGEPSLAEMTQAAIRRLQRETNGYVLLVEGGRIDHAHHEGRAGEALSETVAFDDAIRAALSMTSREDTLIVATADHSHTLTMSGYSPRGAPILGLSLDPDGRPALGRDGRPYTTLGYANGPGSVFATPPRNGEQQAIVRPDLSGVDTQDNGFRQPSLTPLESETHGGEDVALYAWGPGDAMVAGTLEENAVFHIMARALGMSWATAE
ncbi:MAG: alkaline phosphatase [Terricaulis sp.]